MDFSDIGLKMHKWAEDLFPICRSLTGEGVRDTLKYVQEKVNEFSLHSIPTGTKVGDWEVPKEWNIKDAYVENNSGERVIDFKNHNLHVVGYSTAISKLMSLSELQEHLFSLPNQPEAIPYVTSYYSEKWGFCLNQNQRELLRDEVYKVFIDSTLEPGTLDYIDMVLPGESSEEILLSTYVCHPSMANNELSGPVLMMAIAMYLKSLPSRKFTYRLLMAPETIGSIAYLDKHLDHLKSKVKAGWVLTCVGDERSFSYLPTPSGETLTDRVSLKVLAEMNISFKKFSFLERGSDERQWCSPNANLPVASIMRTKYGEYPEYHTSLDDLSVITPDGLKGAFDVYVSCINLLESNQIFKLKTVGEPQLGKRGLYPETSYKGSADNVQDMMNVIAYCDGTKDLIALSDCTKITTTGINAILQTLYSAGLLMSVSHE
jgi:aminopeptidase-like protein